MNKLKNQGFSLTEMALTLAIVGTLSTLTYNYYARTVNDQKRINEGIQLNDFNKAIGNFLTTYQSAAVKYTNTPPYPNNKVLTISPEKLQAYGYFRNPKIVNPSTGKQLYPCASIFFENNQLQSFVYFRTDDAKQSKSESKEVAKLMAGLNTLGGTAGVLLGQDNQYSVKGLKNTWKLDNSAISKYFSNQPNDFLSDGSTNQCKGAYLASQTYSIYTSSILSNLTGQLNDSQIIKQNMNEISTAGQENKIDTLNMDATGIVGTSNTAIAKNKLIFQSNPDCQMNPSILSTMQDYSPNYNGSQDGKVPSGCTSLSQVGCSGLNKANIFGCRNKQLSLGVENAKVNGMALKAVVINGFNLVDTSYQNNQTQTYLGSLSASTIQATATVEYASSCDPAEVGAMAKQKDYSQNTDAVSKLYSLNQNLMVCQKNLLCPQNTGFTDTASIKTCWLPLKPVSAKLTFSTTDKILSFEAPAGFYIRPDSVVYTENPDKSINNLNNGGKWFGNWQGGSKGGNINNGKNSVCDTDKCSDWGLFKICADAYGRFQKVMNSNTDGVYAIPELLENGTASPLNGWNTRRDVVVPSFNAGGVRKNDHSGKYFWVNHVSNETSEVRQDTNQIAFWQDSNKAFKYRFGSTYPYVANSKWDLRQEVYNASTGDAGEGCAQWNGGKVVSFPYYITELVISNDLSTQTVDNNNPPPAPPIPIPDGTCSLANTPLDKQQNARVAANNWNGNDSVTPPQLMVLASPNDGFKITSTRIPSTSTCQIQATANYCPANGEIGCKFTFQYNMAQGWQIKIGADRRGGVVALPNLSSGTVVRNEVWREYPGGYSAHDSITVSEQNIVSGVRIPVNWSNYTGSYSIYHTPGTCQAANTCTNPKTINVYNGSYLVN